MVQFSTDWKEDVAPGEEAKFAAWAGEFKAIQSARNARFGPGRALHRKPIGGVEATLTVRDNLATILPPELHVGPFTAGAIYRAYVRFSNGTFNVRGDDTPDVRGIGIKLIGVGGAKALTGTEEPRTHDLLLIDTPATPIAGPDDFVTLVRLAATGSPATLLPRLLWALGPRRTLKIARAQGRAPFPSYATARFFSATPYRFGPTAARFSLAPVGHPEAPTESSGRDRLVDDLRARLPAGIAWNLQVQLYQDARRTPIEDNSVEWTAEVAPFVNIARLDIPATDPTATRAVQIAKYVENLTFDPWHAPEVLRPIGAMNRARKDAYFASASGRPTVAEPDGTETFEG